MSAGIWLAVAGVGGAGAIVRFLVDGWIGRRIRGRFPLGTLIINLTGAFTLGVLTGAGLTGDALLVAGTATIGSYTTFSTWMLESERLAEDGDLRGAAFNLIGSLVAGVLAAALGKALGGWL